MNPARRGHQIQASTSRKRVAALAAVAVLAAVLGLSAPAAGQGTISDALRQKYSWCFERMSEQACAAAITRWEAQSSIQQAQWQIQIDGINYYRDCPETHSIRVRRSSGHLVWCQQSFHPVGASGGIADAWGHSTEPWRSDDEGNWNDGSRTYSGGVRSCSSQGHSYYVLDRSNWHGATRGCHAHASGGGLVQHEHGTGKHGSGNTGLDQLTTPP